MTDRSTAVVIGAPPVAVQRERPVDDHLSQQAAGVRGRDRAQVGGLAAGGAPPGVDVREHHPLVLQLVEASDAGVRRSLRADVGEAARESVYGTRSRPFPRPFSRPTGGRVAVEAINDHGDEVLTVPAVP